MFKLAFVPALVAAALFLSPGPAQAQQAGDTAAVPALTAAQSAVVARVEDYMNGIRTLEADFLQITNRQEEARGRFYLDRPGKMRIEYAPPSPILLVATGKYLTYIDREIGQVEHITVDNTPAAFFLKNQIRFDPLKAEIRDIIDANGILALTVAQRDDPFAGTLTLTFNKDPMVLRRWRVVDGQGVITEFHLLNAMAGRKLPESLFEVDVPLELDLGN